MKIRKENHTLEEVKCALSHDPESGLITRNKNGKNVGWITTHGYIQLQIGNVTYMAQRIAWFIYHGVWPTGEVDHVNGIKTDNRISNLRDVTRSQNCMNAGMKRTRNKSGYKGVCLHKRSQLWYTQIMKEGKTIFLGEFKDPQIAAIVYDITALELFGPFAKTNF